MQTASEIITKITTEIIFALTSCKLPPWRKPWNDDPNSPGLHTSLSTKNSYRGINQLLLQLAANRHNFASKWWGTFQQVKNLGGHVCRGAKGTQVVFYKPIKRTRTDDNGKEKDDSFCVLKTFVIFNVEQTTGLDQFRVGFDQPAQDTAEKYEQAESVIASIGADIRFGNQAYYSPQHDFIQCPFRHQFESAESYYQTLCHELVHWTEHPNRLNWDRANQGYPMGEIIAEIGGCFLMGELGLPTTQNMDNHVSYINGWLSAMNNDPAFIFKASSQASKAAEYLLSFSRTLEPDLEEVPF